MSSSVTDTDEISDEELLEELRKEELERLQNLTQNVNDTILNDTNINNETILNDNNINNNNNNNNNNNDNQLTTFQENIITTGSEVSIILMIILIILFIIQAIRKIYNHFSLQRAISNVNSAALEAQARKAEDFTPIATDINPKSYAVYNTEFEKKVQYNELKNSDNNLLLLKPKLKNLLLQRAIDCIEKFGTLQRDGTGIRKNWNLDLLPKDVWNDFQLAQKNVNLEFQSIHQENQLFKFEWGKYKYDIFACARDMLGTRVNIKKQEYQQKMKYLQQKNMSNNISKNFGNGFAKGFLNNSKNNKINNHINGNNNNNNNDINNDTNNNKLSRKQRKELKLQKKQQQKQQMLDERAALSEPRRRKPKKKFSNK